MHANICNNNINKSAFKLCWENLFLYELAKLLTTMGMGRVRVNTPIKAKNPPKVRPRIVWKGEKKFRSHRNIIFEKINFLFHKYVAFWTSFLWVFFWYSDHKYHFVPWEKSWLKVSGGNIPSNSVKWISSYRSELRLCVRIRCWALR